MDWQMEFAASTKQEQNAQLDPISQDRKDAKPGPILDRPPTNRNVVEFDAAKQRCIEAFFQRYPDAFLNALLHATIAEFGHLA